MKMLCKDKTAQLGLLVSATGTLIALVAVFFNTQMLEAWNLTSVLENGFFWCFVAMFVGSIIGIFWAKNVKLNEISSLIALFNGFGGLASAIVAFSSYLTRTVFAPTFDLTSYYGIFPTAISYNLTPYKAAVALAVFIGMLTFSASIFAWIKLSRKITGRPIEFRGQTFINIFLLFAGFVAMAIFITPNVEENLVFIAIIALTVIAFLCGFTFTLPIDKRNMPIVVPLLKSLTGIAVIMLGFIFTNTMMIAIGALVVTSSMVIAVVKSKSMNRSLPDFLLRGFGVSSNNLSLIRGGDTKSVSVEDAYIILETAKTVMFIPGFGMAATGAQHAVKELATRLERNGVIVSYCIHPNAGRLPGHINTAFAEAGIQYGRQGTLDEINPLMSLQDVAIVVGANDIVNPSAETDPSSPVYGMPIVRAHEAKTVFVLKRGDGNGFSGAENRLFGMTNVAMLYGDSRETLSSLSNEFEN